MPSDRYTDLIFVSNPIYRRRFDAALRRVLKKHKNWPSIALAIELRLPPGTRFPYLHFKWLQRTALDRALPLPYACALVDIMDGELTLLDFYPYLEGYVTAIPQQKQGVK